MPSTPADAAVLASSTSRMPLSTSLPGHRLRIQSMSRQFSERSKLLVGPGAGLLDADAALEIGLDIAEGLAPAE